MKQTVGVQLLLLYIFSFISYCGFYYYKFDILTMKFIAFLMYPMMALYIGKIWIRRADTKIRRGMQLMFVSFLISIVMAWLLWRQSPVLTYRAMIGVWPFMFYFFLLKCGFSRRDMERYVWVNVIIYLVLWLYALSQAPHVVFGVNIDRELDDQRGIFRIFIANSGCLPLAIFIALNRWNETKRKIYICLAAVCMVLIILRVVRQTIVLTILIGLFYILRRIRYAWVWFLTAFIILQIVTIRFSDDSVMGSLVGITEEEIDANRHGDTNIRIMEYEYFMLEYNNDPIAVLFGNGVAHNESSIGMRNLELSSTDYLYMSDVGYASWYCKFGVFGVVVLIMLMYRAWQKKKPANMEYLTYYIVFIALEHVAMDTFSINAIYFCIAIYLIDRTSHLSSDKRPIVR